MICCQTQNRRKFQNDPLVEIVHAWCACLLCCRLWVAAGFWVFEFLLTLLKFSVSYTGKYIHTYWKKWMTQFCYYCITLDHRVNEFYHQYIYMRADTLKLKRRHFKWLLQSGCFSKGLYKEERLPNIPIDFPLYYRFLCLAKFSTFVCSLQPQCGTSWMNQKVLRPRIPWFWRPALCPCLSGCWITVEAFSWLDLDLDSLVFFESYKRGSTRNIFGRMICNLVSVENGMACAVQIGECDVCCWWEGGLVIVVIQ